MPFPSAGCQTCKTRRIKCDEGQPFCQRCIKSQRICHGMPSGQAWSVFHVEDSYASGQKKRPRGPRATTTVELAASPRAVMQPPQDDLKTQAIMHYVNYYLRPQRRRPNAERSLSDEFLSLWMSKPDCPILDLSVSSMALAVFSRTHHHPLAAMEASMHYNKLLQVVRGTILSLDGGNIDDCLIAIFLMSRFEDTIHGPGGCGLITPLVKRLQSFLHHDGAFALLKYWKYNLSQLHPATNIIKQSRRGLIRSALLRSLALPEWILDGACFGEHGFEFEYDYIIVRIVNIRHRFSTILTENSSPEFTSHQLISTSEALNTEAQKMDKRLQDWAEHFPSHWSRQKHTLTNPQLGPTNDFYSPIVYSYSSPACVVIWCQYYTARMLINNTRLKILELCNKISNEAVHVQLSECHSNMTMMGNDLASSVPFCLQTFRVVDSADSFIQDNTIVLSTNEVVKPYMAALTVWPLSLASSLKYVDDKLKSWSGIKLAHVGRLLGLGVLESAETDKWIEM